MVWERMRRESRSDADEPHYRSAVVAEAAVAGAAVEAFVADEVFEHVLISPYRQNLVLA